MFEINKNVILVKGAVNAAIYDFNTKNVYAINEEAFNIINKVAINKNTPSSEIEKNYINDLLLVALLSKNFIPKTYIPKNNNDAPQLNFAWLELTGGCNLRCLHCYEGTEHVCSSEELSTGQWKNIIRDLKKNGSTKTQLTGGECCLRKDFKELIKYASEQYFKEITVFTNASLLTTELINLFSQKNIKVRFSLYGHTGQVHDSITQVAGSFNKTIENVKKMQSCNIFVTPAIVIMKQNQEFIDEIIAFVKRMGLKYTGYDVIRNVYGGRQSSYTPTNERILNSKKRKKPFFTITKERFEKALHHNTCWYEKFVIMPNGKIAPCIFERTMILGDLTKQTVAEVLNSNQLKYAWDYDFSKINYCKDCEFRFACKDCRPLGLSTNNCMNEKNPRCTYNPYTGKWGCL